MRGFGIFGAVAAFAFAATSVCAQTATTEPVGKPLALLAGLRPPHEAKHKDTEHAVHARAAHSTSKKTAARTRHTRAATVHTRHASAKKLAKQKHETRERPVTASAFAEEPPAQAAPDLMPASVQPVANAGPVDGTAAPATGPAVAPVSKPVSENAPPIIDRNAEPAAAKIQTVEITAPNQATVPDRPADDTIASAPTPSDRPAVAPPSQTVLAAPVQEQKSKHADPVGSASWIAQVLAALGGAVAAGAVAWFLIGSGPVRTYG